MTSESTVELFVPGRVCLLGEHTDWASTYHQHNSELSPHGHCLVYGTEVGLHAKASRSANGKLVLHSTDYNGKEYELELDWDLKTLRQVAAEGGYFSYMAGTAAYFLSHATYSKKVSAITLNNYSTTLPMGKGLSSSAAVCVLTAKAFNEVFQLELDTKHVMTAAYEGEVLTPSKCGKMDQCVAFGRSCVNMRFHSGSMHCEALPIPEGKQFFFVVADLNAGKDTTAILTALSSAFPHAKDAVHDKVQEFLGKVSLEWTKKAEEALREGDAAALGKVLVEAQASLREHLVPICPEQLTSPKLYRVLEDERLQPYIYGGKGVGSQGDGSIQFVCRDQASQAKVCEILEKDLGCTPFPMNLKGTAVLVEDEIPSFQASPLTPAAPSSP